MENQFKEEFTENQNLYCTIQYINPQTPNSILTFNQPILPASTSEVPQQSYVPTNYQVCESYQITPIIIDPKRRTKIIKDKIIKASKPTHAEMKVKANTNKPYINKKGEEVQPREFDTEFHCTCPKKCTDNKNLPLKTRKQIFTTFWGVGTFEGRCVFINSCVNEIPKLRCYTKNKDNQKRKNTRKYYLKGVEVCKVTFLKTLMISKSRVDISLAKAETETFTDKRGKKKSPHAFSDQKNQLIVDHIKSTYRAESSLKVMWQNYMTTYPEDHVSESSYKRMFYKKFNLKFKRRIKKGL